jgi:pyruvate dehydrogenase E2 component (dihydrolipoyllysine-residue acetyltransferase)
VAADVIMPALGMAQDTGTVLRWLKSEGDTVSRGEPLIEVETDKATVEVESPCDGILSAVRAGAGEQVPVGEVVAVVLAPGEARATAPAPARPQPAILVPASAAVQHEPAPRGAGRRLASPKARRMAAELGFDVGDVEGSGPGGAVLAADVERHRVSGLPAEPTPEPATAVPTGSVWRIMAERTTRSWQDVPHFFLHRQVDAGRLVSWRAAARARPGGERVSHTDLLVRIAAEALQRHPHVNATWRDGVVELGATVGVSIAVATDDGLVVPVVHGADRMSLVEIIARRIELVARARTGRLRPDDLEGGTFTISNLGMYGVDSFDAILNAPQAAILAVGRIADRVVAVDGAAVVRPMIDLSLSCDHRVVDGARGAEFLQTLASLVEEPAGLVA